MSKKQALLDAAIPLFAHKGYQATTTAVDVDATTGLMIAMFNGIMRCRGAPRLDGIEGLRGETAPFHDVTEQERSSKRLNTMTFTEYKKKVCGSS